MKIIKEYKDYEPKDENISSLEDIFFELSDNHDVEIGVDKNLTIGPNDNLGICLRLFGLGNIKVGDVRTRERRIRLFLEEVTYAVYINPTRKLNRYESENLKESVKDLIKRSDAYFEGKELSYLMEIRKYEFSDDVKLIFIKNREESAKKLMDIIYHDRSNQLVNESVGDNDVNTISDILEDDDIEFTITPYVEKKHLQKGLHSLIGMVRVNVDYSLSKDSSLIEDMKNLFFRYMPDYIKPEEIKSVNILNQSNKSLRRIFAMTGYKLKWYEFRYEDGISYVFLYLEK